MPLPNLFIIGAAKCGTTSLHHALDRHPEIFMSRLKEPAFFVPELKYHPKDLDWYLTLFEGARAAQFVGESSTHYTKYPLFKGVPQRVHAFSPNARLIYLMRDPIERAISHYWHNTRSVRPEFRETRPMLQAIREDELYRAYGDYAMQVEPWLDLFGRDALLPLVYEELISDAEKTLEHVFRWLGISPLPDLALERRNARPEGVMRSRGAGLLQRFRHSFAWGGIAPFVPQVIKDWARGLAVEIKPSDFEDQSEAVVALLRPWAQEKTAAVARLFERDFSEWRTSGES